MELATVWLLPSTGEPTKTETDHLAKIFTDPAVIRYLNMVLTNLITDHANVPLPVLAADLQEAAIKQAFVKGGISVIHMLLSISKDRPQPAPTA